MARSKASVDATPFGLDPFARARYERQIQVKRANRDRSSLKDG